MAEERWATFDCYGTLIDWMGGIRDTLSDLWPEHDAELLLSAYHEIEPEVQRGTALPYRQVLAGVARTRRAPRGARARRRRPAGARRLAAELAAVRRGAGLARRAPRRGAGGSASCPTPTPAFLAASLEAIGVPVDLEITAAEAGSYKPAHAHWERFFEQTGADRDRHVHVARLAVPRHRAVPTSWGSGPSGSTGCARARPAARGRSSPDLAKLPETLDDLVGA